MTRKLAMKRVKPKEIHVGRAYRMALPFLAGPSEQIAVVVSIRPATARSTQVKVEWLLPGAGLLNVYAGRVPAPCVARRAFGSALKGPPMTKDTTAGGVEAIPPHEGWRYGELIYNALYASKGGQWSAVSDSDKAAVWYPAGYRFAVALALTPPATGDGAGAVPAGWQLVPIEPTDAMLKPFGGRHAPNGGSNRAGYRAMLAASPAPAPAVGVENLMQAVRRAEDGAGSLPARDAVKLRPADWHAVCDAARKLASPKAGETGNG